MVPSGAIAERVSTSGEYPQFRSTVIDAAPVGTFTKYQSVSPVVIVPVVIGDITEGRIRLPAGVTEYPALFSTFCAETPDMSAAAQIRSTKPITDTLIVYRLSGFGTRLLKLLTQSSTGHESGRQLR